MSIYVAITEETGWARCNVIRLQQINMDFLLHQFYCT